MLRSAFLVCLLLVTTSSSQRRRGPTFTCGVSYEDLSAAAAQLSAAERDNYEGNNDGTSHFHYSSDTNLFWPEGIVKYKLDRDLTSEDIAEVRIAFREYETRTCVRFQEPLAGEHFTRIMINTNDKKCGVATIGRQVHGNQYTSFGPHKICRTKWTIIHELGHTLGLLHEHQREDREQYVSHSSQPVVYSEGVTKGLYNYYSVMHYQCQVGFAGTSRTGSVQKCGIDAHSGLTPLDADGVNAMYKCQGCFRHRWQPLSVFAFSGNKELSDIGPWSPPHDPKLPCRGYGIPGEIGIGTYSHLKKTCEIAAGGGSVTSLRGASAYLLTIPGGFSQDGFTYSMMKVESGQRLQDPDKAIAAGIGVNGNGIGLIAVLEDGYDVTFGKVWLQNGVLSQAEFPVKGSNPLRTRFSIVVCSQSESKRERIFPTLPTRRGMRPSPEVRPSPTPTPPMWRVVDKIAKTFRDKHRPTWENSGRDVYYENENSNDRNGTNYHDDIYSYGKNYSSRHPYSSYDSEREDTSIYDSDEQAGDAYVFRYPDFDDSSEDSDDSTDSGYSRLHQESSEWPNRGDDFHFPNGVQTYGKSSGNRGPFQQNLRTSAPDTHWWKNQYEWQPSQDTDDYRHHREDNLDTQAASQGHYFGSTFESVPQQSTWNPGTRPRSVNQPFYNQNSNYEHVYSQQWDNDQDWTRSDYRSRAPAHWTPSNAFEQDSYQNFETPEPQNWSPHSRVGNGRNVHRGDVNDFPYNSEQGNYEYRQQPEYEDNFYEFYG